jgi:hypothetical protein
MPLSVIIQAILGGVFGVLNIYLPWVIDGKLVMALEFVCGKCLGIVIFLISSPPLLHRPILRNSKLAT